MYRIVCNNNAPIFGITADEATSAFAAKVYPNPTANEMNIEFSSDVEKVVIVSLYDILGNKVMEQQQEVAIGSSLLTAYLNEFTNGMYLLRVLDLEGNSLYKANVVKQ